MSTLRVYLDGIGLCGPGMAGWTASRDLLAGTHRVELSPTILPPAEALPPAERRRVGVPIKLSMAIGFEAVHQAGVDPATLAAVFSSTGGDCDNCHAILETLASDDRQISPTRFHNSVHNAAAGYWGIATGAMAPCQVLCAFDASFGAGLLDALGQVVLDRQSTLLIAYDSEYPQPLFAKRPVPDVAGVGLVLAPQRTERSLAQITVAPDTANAEPLADAALENLRTAIPALRALPLLRKLALGEGGAICLDYLPPMQLGVAIQPC